MTETITTPADLAAFKHRVPDGLKAPGQPVLMIDRDGSILLLSDGANMVGFPDAAYWTREPVEPPRPALPTAHGSVITNVRTKDGREFPRAFLIDSDTPPWAAPFGSAYIWLDDHDIVSFDHARSVPNGVGVMDEDDKSPVVDRDGDTWEWDGAWDLWSCRGSGHRGTKLVIDLTYGPIHPADKGGQS